MDLRRHGQLNQCSLQYKDYQRGGSPYGLTTT